MKINKGDSKETVLKSLGEPKAFSPMSNGVVWDYLEKCNSCSIYMENDTVVLSGCQDIPTCDHGNRGLAAVGAVFKGFGDGYSANRNNTINCTSTTYGTQTQTNCH